MPEVKEQLDVRKIEPKRKHPSIFETFDGLEPGQAMVITNDHDPKPLHYQFEFERKGKYSWEYLENGPEVWKVQIGRTA